MLAALRSFRPADSWVRLWLVPVLAFVALAGDHQYLADFWHHLARGREIVNDGRLLDHDIFTFTVAGQPFQDVNWLTQVVYYALFQAGGLALVQVANALVVALSLGLLVNYCGRVSGSLVAAMAVGILTFLGLWQVLTIRPQTFSLFLFVLLMDVLERSARRPWLVYVVPPAIIALWANMHGAFPAGLLLLTGWTAGEAIGAWRKDEGKGAWPQAVALLGSCLLSALATLATPYGWHIFDYVSQTSQRAAARRIDEWMPPSFDQWIGAAFFGSLVVVAALLVLSWRRGYRPRPRDIVLGLGFLVLAARSVRMVVWWLLVLAPPLTAMLAKLLPAADAAAERRPSRGAAVSFVALILLAVFSIPGLQRFNPLLALRQQPRVEADLDAVHAELAKRFERANVFTRFEWGEYLEWVGHPRFKVFMDGRIEIYPDEVWNDYQTVTLGSPGWQALLEKYKVDVLVLDAEYHARFDLLPQLERAGWAKVFQARSALLFIRK